MTAGETAIFISQIILVITYLTTQDASHTLSGMAWIHCQNDRESINLAGRQLVNLPPSHPDRDAALDIINNWRSCHSYPLHSIKMNLSRRAKKKINTNALVSQRIKRLSSISLKLQHNPDMRLSQMQDIGGCRAVLNSVVEVEKLVEVYERTKAKNPNSINRPLLLKKYDYISNPKPDGYRSVHLIMKYQSRAKKWNGQKIEIQIRSKLQHAWATAVETCQTFTGQTLKSKIKSASETWVRFFTLMSTAIALREKRTIVPGTPQAKELKAEITALEKKENVIALLNAWNVAMRHQQEMVSPDSAAFLLELDISKRLLNMKGYTEDLMGDAHAQYLAREKATETDPNIQVVLVSADSVAALKRAYPNYYVDTSAFIAAIKLEIG